MQYTHASTNQSNSCPNTPYSKSSITNDQDPLQYLETISLFEMSNNNNSNNNNSNNNSNNNNNYDNSCSNNNSRNSRNSGNKFKSLTRHFSHYARFKNVLQKSLKRSKSYVCNEMKRLSTSITFPINYGTPTAPSHVDAHNQTDLPSHSSASTCSTYNLEALFALNEEMPVITQIAQAVSICRQLPELEISAEMVEAERLLLYSTLRRNAMMQQQQLSLVKMTHVAAHITDKPPRYCRRFFIDAMRLPIKPNPSQDIFFNYFYICTFNCGGIIKSTQSVECCNYEVIFRNCGIEFVLADTTSKDGADDGGGGGDEGTTEVTCDVFMLRLRKVSTLSLEPKKSIIKLPAAVAIASPNSTTSSSGSDEIVSRFRLHASFTINALDFAPYEYVENESKKCDILCLHAATGSWNKSLISRKKSTNLTELINISGHAEVRLPKQTFSGFLNVQDPHSQHNWNRRWCTLDNLYMNIWKEMSDDLDLEQPLYQLNLYENLQKLPLCAAPRELCARMRAFCLQCAIKKSQQLEITDDVAAVFFAADTQEELEMWLQHLNKMMSFLNKWLQYRI